MRCAYQSSANRLHMLRVRTHRASGNLDGGRDSHGRAEGAGFAATPYLTEPGATGALSIFFAMQSNASHVCRRACTASRGNVLNARTLILWFETSADIFAVGALGDLLRVTSAAFTVPALASPRSPRHCFSLLRGAESARLLATAAPAQLSILWCTCLRLPLARVRC